MKKGITYRKLIHYYLIFIVFSVLTKIFINYFQDPENIFIIGDYLPTFIGGTIGFFIVFFINYQNNPGDIDTKITDERDEELGKEYNSKMLPIFLFYIPTAFILYAIAMKIETFSVMSFSIVLYLMFVVYGIGFLLYKNAKS
ncbi:hypothetical protein ACMGE6_01795 [Macrococcus equi]|uniref:hypothetical protein n=1 Tax=Macrococcus equi TaxID=3395462 RepID=UPI0039BE4210